MPYTDLENNRMFYGESGEGEPVVFLHGFTLDRRMWQPQVEYFDKHYRVIVPDALGHGLSDAPQTGYSRDHRVEDLKQFADSLGLDKFHLVGLSMGGSTGIGYALKYQNDLKSLVLASTGAAGYGVGKKFSLIDKLAKEKGLEPAREKWKRSTLTWYRGGRAHLRKFVESMIDEYSGAAWIDPMRGKYPQIYDLDNVHKITVPTLILAGELDKIFVPLSEKLKELIPGSELTIFKEAGHMLNLELPEDFNVKLKAFLDRVNK